MLDINSLEEERLAALQSYQILDTDIEEDFDQLTELAAAICQTPIALISLVDRDRQWFKSNFGLNVRETERCHSFCSHAITEPEKLMQIENALEDQRFHENPLVTGEPHIRFYAGVPLVNEDGYALGSLCVIDQNIKALNETQKKALKTLAKQVVDKLALRKKIFELESTQRALQSTEKSLQESNDKVEQSYLIQERDHHQLQTSNSKLAVAESSLKNTEFKLNVAIESAGLGIWTMDLPTEKIDINQQFKQLFGLDEDQNLNFKSIYSSVCPDYQDLLRKSIQESLEKRKPLNLLYKIITKDSGEERWLKGMGNVQLDLKGKPNTFVGINIDVTSEVENGKKTEELNAELKAKELRLQNILDIVGEGIGITDEKGNIVYTNHRNREIFKIDEEEMLQLSNSSAVWNNSRLDGSPMPDSEHPISHTIKTGETVNNYKFIIQDAKGVSKYLRMNTTPIKDSLGNITGAIGSFADISDSHLLLERLKQEEEKMRMAIQSANLGTFYIEIPTMKFIPSDRLKELFGFHPEEKMPYEAAITQILDSHRDSVVAAVESAIKNDTTYENEYPIIGYHDQKIRWVRATGKLYKDSVNSEASHFSGTIADITERRLDEQRRGDFIGMVSHDLRNPLTIIKGYNYLLDKQAKLIDNPNIIGSVDKINLQVKRMESMIEGFLEVAKFGEGKIKLQRSKFDISELMKSTEENIVGLANSHQIIFEIANPIDIDADRNKIEQVIINFINNAIKYSQGGTTITASSFIDQDKVYFSVIDEGMGIEPKDQPYIFDRFYRVQSEEMEQKKGFGIGLYICKEIIESHQGEVGVESVKGEGSRFWFSLPVIGSQQLVMSDQ